MKGLREEWKNRPAWVRSIVFGSGRILMTRHQHLKMEVIGVVSGVIFAMIGALDVSEFIAPASARFPLLLCASLLFLAAYRSAVVIRVGDQYSVWPWLELDMD